MANPGTSLPGVAVESSSEKFDLYSTSVRILGSVVGIVAALLLNSAALLALMLLTRILIELGDVAVGLILNGGADANTVTLALLAAVVLYMLVFLVGRIRSPRA